MIDYSLAAPEIFLTAAICLVLVVDVFLRDDQRRVTYFLTMLTLVGAAAVTAMYAVDTRTVTFSVGYAF